ncbi:MAG: hypothetical protein D5R97_03215 [Candidatus Syntrophonatronum acetioxidans]|uniref:Uncharacterized protein n=1 Tax=Candidatus Syntrophonatronum acetioxidans TaxID=1795816 RepID=A0A424YGF6_9FIRM|nr:MAG: hypothetical protein D5R97_03215 [Candidatus Syntrophonatronum acetioxidans]
MVNNNEKDKSSQVTEFSKEAGYYLQKGVHCLNRSQLKKALKYFRKTIETDPHNTYTHYNIAYILSRIDYLKDINETFQEILGTTYNLPEASFLAAIYYSLTGEMDLAEKELEKFLEIAPEGEIMEEAREMLNLLSGEEEIYENLSYIKLSEKYEGVIQTVKEKVKRNLECPFFRVKMLENLYQLDDDLTSNIIFLYGLAENSTIAERVLRHFIKSSWAKEMHKELAMLALRDIGAEEPYEVMMENRIVKVTLKEYFERIPQWEPQWYQVMEKALENIKYNKYHSKTMEGELKEVWNQYIKVAYPEIPPVRDINLWSAALEYLTFKKRGINLNHKEISLKYRVFPEELLEKYKEMGQALSR